MGSKLFVDKYFKFDLKFILINLAQHPSLFLFSALRPKVGTADNDVLQKIHSFEKLCHTEILISMLHDNKKFANCN